jgi:hypothetical protein
MKKLLSVFLLMFGFVLFSNSAKASEVIVSDDFTEEQIIAVYEQDPISGALVEVSIDDYLDDVNNVETVHYEEPSDEIGSEHFTHRIDKNIIQPFAAKPYFFYKFIKTSSSYVHGVAVRITPGSYCNKPTGCDYTTSLTTTLGRSYSTTLSLTSEIKDVISTSIGYTYTSTTSYQMSTATTSVLWAPYGVTAAVAFKPRLHKFVGNIEKWEQYPVTQYYRASYPATVLQPTKIGGYADGYYILVNYNTGAEIK